MEIRDLRFLTAAAGAGSFARAAQSLGLMTSTVSRRISQLEDELGVPLFERGQFGVRLTAGGRRVLVHVRRALAALDEVERAGASNGAGEVGCIRLGVRIAPIGEPLGGLLGRWRQQHPHVALVISELNDRDLAEALRERRLDVALAVGHTVDSNAANIRLYDEVLFVALPVAHRWAGREGLSWQDLREQTVLGQGWDESQSTRDFCSSRLGPDTRFRGHSASEQSLLALVAAGFGVALVRNSQAQAGFPGVIFVPIAEPDARLDIFLAWLPSLEDATVGRFVAFLRDGVKRL